MMVKSFLRQPDPPGDLFHYTTQEGLLGILESGTFRAANALYMNDASEIAHAGRVLNQVISPKLHASDPITRRVAEFFHRDQGPVKSHPSYVFSLSEQPDQLGQWRAYARQGDGYAIGFSADALDATRTTGSCHLAKVVYDEEKQKAILQRLFNFFDELLHEHGSTNVESDLIVALPPLIELMVLFKDPTFREEQEWRLVVRPASTGEVKLRASCGHLVPYVEVRPSTPLRRDGGLLPISTIIQGPRVSPNLGEHALRGLLNRLDYSDKISIKSSKVPLR